MIRIIISVLLTTVGSASLVLGAFPDTFSASYGFISHGGIGPHGHYLPAVAHVKIHKDPFQSHYSLDEEGPMHYKYVRQSSSPDPIIHHPPPLVHQPHHHHHHHPVAPLVPAVAPIAPAAPVVAPHHHHHHHPVPIHGGVISVPAAPAAVHLPVQAALGLGGAPYFADYGSALPHGGYY